MLTNNDYLAVRFQARSTAREMWLEFGRDDDLYDPSLDDAEQLTDTIDGWTTLAERDSIVREYVNAYREQYAMLAGRRVA